MKANAPALSTIVALALSLVLAGCASAPAPVPQPAPRPIPRPVPPPPPPPAPTDWRDAARTPGDWQWSMEGGRSTARYRGADGQALLTLTCDAASRQIVFARGIAAPAGTVPMVVTTPSQRRLLNAAPLGGQLTAGVPARDPLLDAIAFTRGRFMVEVPGAAVLYLPAWAEPARVIEDCR